MYIYSLPPPRPSTSPSPIGASHAYLATTKPCDETCKRTSGEPEKVRKPTQNLCFSPVPTTSTPPAGLDGTLAQFPPVFFPLLATHSCRRCSMYSPTCDLIKCAGKNIETMGSFVMGEVRGCCFTRHVSIHLSSSARW